MYFDIKYDLTTVLSSFAVSLIICLTILKWFRERNYPPGPKGLPLIGYGIFLGKNPNETLRNLKKKYGDIFSFYHGPVLHVCISEYNMAKELLSSPLTLFRPPYAFDFLVGQGGVGGMNGEGWQEQRRFTMYTMRNLGLGKGLWETMIQGSAEEFIHELKSWNGKPINIEAPLIFNQASNSISLFIGRPLDKEKDAKDIEIIRKSTREFMEFFPSTSVVISMPSISKLLKFFHLGGYHRFFSLLRQFEEIFRKEVERRMKLPESLTKDDYIGCYFQEMMKKEKDTKLHSFTTEVLLGNLLMFFIAGNDSTMASISWLLLLMCKHQDIQKKIHEEIDLAIGRDGVVSYDDRGKLPYVMATIFEMNRWISINPIYPPRYPTETFTFHGYTIPQGCHIITHIWSIMRDPRYFKDPEEFMPERFIADNGARILKMDGFAPFSIGKRNCPGEGIAIMTTFLYFTSIMQKFRVTIPPGSVVDLEPVFGGALLPKAQEMCFIER